MDACIYGPTDPVSYRTSSPSEYLPKRDRHLHSLTLDAKKRSVTTAYTSDPSFVILRGPSFTCISCIRLVV